MNKIKFSQTTTPETIAFNINNLRNLVFEVTDACNLQCKYCGYSELYEGYDDREDSYLSFKKAKLMIDYLAEIWRREKLEKVHQRLNIGFYGGEPLLNMDFVKEVILYAKRLKDIGKTITHNMTTNAMLLDRHMDFLAENKVRLLISLDGDEYGHSYRLDKAGNNSFKRVMRNVRLLKEKHIDYFEKYVNFNSVLHNRDEVEGIFSFIRHEFSKNPRVSALNNSGIREDKKEEFYQTYKNPLHSFEMSSDCAKLAEDMFISAPPVEALSRHLYHNSGNLYDNYRDLVINTEITGRGQSGTCVPFMIKMFVTVNGKILQCEKINHEFALGQIHEDRIELNLQGAADKQNGYLKNLEKQCLICVNNKKCGLCIYQIDHLDYPNVHCRNFSTSDNDMVGKKIMDFLGRNPHMYRRIHEQVTIS